MTFQCSTRNTGDRCTCSEWYAASVSCVADSVGNVHTQYIVTHPLAAQQHPCMLRLSYTKTFMELLLLVWTAINNMEPTLPTVFGLPTRFGPTQCLTPIRLTSQLLGALKVTMLGSKCIHVPGARYRVREWLTHKQATLVQHLACLPKWRDKKHTRVRREKDTGLIPSLHLFVPWMWERA